MSVTQARRNTSPLPIEPSVLSAFVDCDNSEILIDIPWVDCKLTGCTFCCSEPETSTTNTGQIDLELNAAGGGDMFRVTVAASQAAGTQVDGVLQNADNCENLSRDDPNRDKINLEVTKGSSAGWNGMLYMYFAPQRS